MPISGDSLTIKADPTDDEMIRITASVEVMRVALNQRSGWQWPSHLRQKQQSPHWAGLVLR
jgi:hypothetical protein